MDNWELIDIENIKKNTIHKIRLDTPGKHLSINEMRVVQLDPGEIRGGWLSSDAPVWLWGIEGKGILHLREANQYTGKSGRYVTIPIGNDSPFAVRINPFTTRTVKNIGQDKLIYIMGFEGNQAEHIRIFDPEIETHIASQQAVLEKPADYWKKQNINGLIHMDNRFKEHGRIWGDEPAIFAELAVQIFNQEKVTRVYVPGCAYGRNCIAFARRGMDVIGVDISKVAIEMGQKWAKEWVRNIRSKILLHCGNVLNTDEKAASFDAVFLGKVLHQFRENNIKELVKEIARVTKPNGLVFIASFHRKDPAFGYGLFINKNIFDERGWRPVRFFNEGEVGLLFQEFFDIIEENVYIESEEHLSTLLSQPVSHYHRLIVVLLKRKRK